MQANCLFCLSHLSWTHLYKNLSYWQLWNWFHFKTLDFYCITKDRWNLKAVVWTALKTYLRRVGTLRRECFLIVKVGLEVWSGGQELSNYPKSKFLHWKRIPSDYLQGVPSDYSAMTEQTISCEGKELKWFSSKKKKLWFHMMVNQEHVKGLKTRVTIRWEYWRPVLRHCWRNIQVLKQEYTASKIWRKQSQTKHLWLRSQKFLSSKSRHVFLLKKLR